MTDDNVLLVSFWNDLGVVEFRFWGMGYIFPFAFFFHFLVHFSIAKASENMLLNWEDLCFCPASIESLARYHGGGQRVPLAIII